MKRRILLFMMTALLSVGAWAADDLTLNPSETVSFGEWGFDNSGAPTLVFGNWAAGGGWQFDTALSQDDYCGVEFAFNATTEVHVTFFINYEGGAEQSIDVPIGSTGIKAGFAFDGGITKMGFKYGDWESTANEDGASITITSAVVKAHSTGEVTELTFADLQENNDPATKNGSDNSFSLTRYQSYVGWYFANINSNDYDEVVITFSEAIPDDGIQLNAIGAGDGWSGTQIAGLTKGATKVTAYFSAKPDVTISSVGFYYNWNSKQGTEEDGPTTLKIASAKLYKKPQTVTITDAKYATCVTTAATDFSQTDGITAYIATVNAAKTKVELTEVTKVAAGVPVILNGAAKDYTLHYTTESTNDVSANQLLVSDGTATGGDGIYALANKSKGVGFYPVEDGVTIPAGKVYLNTSAGVKEFLGFDFGGETAISAIANGQSSNGQWYNLAGQRVQTPTRGIYIQNGKKVIIK